MTTNITMNDSNDNDSNNINLFILRLKHVCNCYVTLRYITVNPLKCI